MGGNNGHDNHKLGAWWGERIELLKALWRKGLSASEIGNELGVTRNAVIGKLHRIEGYTPEPHKPAPRTAKPPPAPVWKPPPPPKPARRVVINAPFLNLTLDELKRGVCHYPHGEHVPYRFCGQPVKDGAPWCALHCRIVYSRRPDQSASRPWR
jgi:GcrA cell cycle regulator